MFPVALFVTRVGCTKPEGRYSDAYAALVQTVDPRSASHHLREQFGAVIYLAEAAVCCGHDDGLRSMIERIESSAEESGSPVVMSQLSFARTLASSDGMAEQALLDCLTPESSQGSWIRALRQVAHGGRSRRQRRVTQARAAFGAAHAVLPAMDARHWVRESEAEIDTDGAPEFSFPSSSIISATAAESPTLRAEQGRCKSLLLVE